MMKISVTLLVLLYGVLVSSHENKYVPVFMWSNDREKEFSQVFAGHFTSKFDFQSRFISKVADNVLLFIQDKLSLPDILLHGSVFGEDQEEKDYDNLKMLMSDYVSSFLPNVEHAALAVSQIFESDDSFNVLKINAKNLHETKDLNAMLSTNSKKNLFIIDFSHSELSQKEIDKLIGMIVSHFKSSNQFFTAYYTANESNEDSDGSLASGSRHLLAAEDDGREPIKSDNFLFYFDDLIVDKSKNLTIPYANVQVKDNDCGRFTNVTSSVSCSVKLNLGDADEYKNMELELYFETSGAVNSGYWFVSKAVLSYSNTTLDEVITASVGDKLLDPTPLGYSYSCYEQEPLYPSSSPNFTTKGVPALTFVGLQFEVFMKNGDKFGFYNDCVGFFTIGIWMFLISAAILITILLFGVTMLMSINTMDRYDDPKGKSIAIAAGD